MEVVTELLDRNFEISFLMTLPGEFKITINHTDGEIPTEELVQDIKQLIERMGNEVTSCETINQIIVTYKV